MFAATLRATVVVLQFISDSSTQTLVLDIAITHLLMPSNVNSAERAPGQPTSADEKTKRDKYEAECRSRNYDFVPFAVDNILGI